MKHLIAILTAALVLATGLIRSYAQPTAFTYQGRLTDRLTGNPVPNGFYDLNYTNYDGDTPGANVMAWYSTTVVGVTNGLFSVAVDFGPGVFTGSDRWLGLSVRTNGAGVFDTLSPQQKILSSPYAIFANMATNLAGTLDAEQLTGTLPAEVFVNANGAGLTNLNATELDSGTVPDERLAPNVARTNQVWLLSGNRGTTAVTDFLGTADDQALELKVNGRRALRLEPNSLSAPNVIGGGDGNVVESGVQGATIGGGGDLQNGFSQGVNRIATGAHMSTIAGGYGNVILTNAAFGFIGGGRFNTIANDTWFATIGGGQYNMIDTNASFSFVGEGEINSIGSGSTHATITGGRLNSIRANSPYSVIGGGGGNRISFGSQSTTIAGGYSNLVLSNSSFSSIGGGDNSYILENAAHSTIAGGYNNRIYYFSDAATIGGGVNNTISSNATGAAIGGGAANYISSNAVYATIPGGASNSAASYSFAAGHQAKANHAGTFVWADSPATNADFASTGANQFLIRASGGVGINKPNPATALDVNGTVTATALQGNGAGLTGLNAANISSGTLADLRLSANVALLNAAQTFTADKTFGAGAQIFADGGSALAPGLSFSGDGDTGVFHPLANTLAFATVGTERLRVNSAGDVGIGTTAPMGRLDVNGTTVLRGNASVDDAATMSFGSLKRQMLNLFSTSYGVGVQDNTLYLRSNKRFSWFDGGVHTDTENGPGAGGTWLMTLTAANGLNVSGVVTATAFVPSSDRNLKENFRDVSPREILQKVVGLPITRWNFKVDEHTAHLGPMAQDFYAAFGVGPDDKHIATVDADGVALAAIQGLNQKLEETRADLKQREFENAALEARLERLEKLLSATAAKN